MCVVCFTPTILIEVWWIHNVVLRTAVHLPCQAGLNPGNRIWKLGLRRLCRLSQAPQLKLGRVDGPQSCLPSKPRHDPSSVFPVWRLWWAPVWEGQLCVAVDRPLVCPAPVPRGSPMPVASGQPAPVHMPTRSLFLLSQPLQPPLFPISASSFCSLPTVCFWHQGEELASAQHRRWLSSPASFPSSPFTCVLEHSVYCPW